MMDIIKLAEALGVDTTCKMSDIQRIRCEFGVGIETARVMLIEPRIYDEIKTLVSIIKDTYND